MPRRVCIETTIPSYLTARPSRDIVQAARQQLTREWWDVERHNYDLCISQIVLDEAAAGDAEAAQRRMTVIDTFFSLKDAPALIERLLPVQKLSAEAYKEQMAGSGKTLTALGSYWKGRKPLILNKACILGCLLPATDDPARDLEIFEKLMAMDDESFVARWKRRPRPKEILATLSIARIADYFTVEPEGVLPASAPVDWSKPEYATVKVAWRADLQRTGAAASGGTDAPQGALP